MRSLQEALRLARDGRLYPSVILYGGGGETRQSAALDFARVLLCQRTDRKGCFPDAADTCRHCRRLHWPAKGEGRFHPDFHVLERDLRTATSVGATKSFLQPAWASPFEAAGQVFVIAEADSLSGGAADALLKLLEEPPDSSPRHFFLLAASRLDLLPTLRSRSLSLFLGRQEPLPEDSVATVYAALARALDVHRSQPSPIDLFGIAAALATADGWDDPRARRPWAIGADAILRYLADQPDEFSVELRRRLLLLAQELLDSPRMRLRGIPHSRILEGLVSRRLSLRT